MLTLEQVGAVVRGPRGFRLGMLLVALSNNVVLADLLQEAGRAIITKLANHYRLTVHIGMLDAGMVTYVAKVTARKSWAPHTRIGSQLEAYCSALGKVLLSALSPEELQAFITSDDLVALTAHTITDPDLLRHELSNVRSQGYAIDDREMCMHTRCIAIPIYNAGNQVVAAMSVTDHADRMTSSRLIELRQPLAEAVHALQEKIFSFSTLNGRVIQTLADASL